MNRFSILFLAFTVFFSSEFLSAQDSISLEEYIQKNNIEARKGNGLFYTIQKEGYGEYPKPGDYVKVHYSGKLLNGHTFDASEPNDPFVFQLGYRQVILGWERGIPLIPLGGKGTLYIPSQLGYGRAGAGNAIPPESSLVFEIEVVEILDQQAYDDYMDELDAKEQRAYEAHVENQFVQDKRLINDYASENKLRVKRTNSGLSYAIKKKGKGELLKKGDLVSVHYEGFLLDGTLFDSSYKNKKPFTFQLGKGKAIKGWEEGLLHFKKNSEGWLLIPSKLAYGPRSIKEEGISIPADAVLIFKIKVVNVIRAEAG